MAPRLRGEIHLRGRNRLGDKKIKVSDTNAEGFLVKWAKMLRLPGFAPGTFRLLTVAHKRHFLQSDADY